MNKKIKIIELLNKIANGEKVSEEIKYKDNIYTWLDYKYIDNQGYTFNIYSNRYDLNDEVEILEDNTEEIEELLTIEDYECDKTDIRLNREKINELIKAINEIRKEKSNE